MKAQTALKIASITDHDVASVISMREALEGLKRRTKLLEESLKTAESELIERLSRGALNESSFEIFVKITERRYPAWKEHYLAMAGVEAASRVLEETKPAITQSLVVKSVLP
ncbi:MAG: hypothetical protein JST16_05385 [Bdellovibrionales bacterium]|nr:hypothetical protein [Bdellovibrionales bacterium]